MIVEYKEFFTPGGTKIISYQFIGNTDEDLYREPSEETDLAFHGPDINKLYKDFYRR